MEMKQSPPVAYFIPAAFFLTVIGWIGLILLFFYTLPTNGPRWLFFFLSVLAVTGPFIPVMAFLNIRFPSEPPVTGKVILREAILVGVYVPTLAWLQLGRALTPALGVLLAFGFFLIAWLIRLREKARWEP